jgi:hypothetical protein
MELQRLQVLLSGLAARFDDIVARAPDWPIDAAALAAVAVALV